jgi:ribosomal protein S1
MKNMKHNPNYMTADQFKHAIRTGDTQGKKFTRSQWQDTLYQVWKRKGQVYGKVTSKTNDGYTIDLLGEHAFMHAADAHEHTEDYLDKTVVFEIKRFERTIYRGKEQVNIIVTNNTHNQ